MVGQSCCPRLSTTVATNRRHHLLQLLAAVPLMVVAAQVSVGHAPSTKMAPALRLVTDQPRLGVVPSVRDGTALRLNARSGKNSCAYVRGHGICSILNCAYPTSWLKSLVVATSAPTTCGILVPFMPFAFYMCCGLQTLEKDMSESEFEGAGLSRRI